MAPPETPPGAEDPFDSARPDRQRSDAERVPAPVTAARPRRGSLRARYENLDQHELVMLLDEVDDERARARFRESIYIAVIFWLIVGWVLIYGPRYLWHPPVIVMAPDEKRPSTMTYLDTPPDLQKQLHKPAPAISERDSQSQSPKPNPRVQPQPRAGTPAPPAPKPQPARPAPQQQPTPQPPQQPQPQPQQQTARNTPPTPAPPAPKPQPLADAPAPSPNAAKPNFNNQQSAAQAIQQAARGSRSAGESGDYGSTGRGQMGGTKSGYQILSDTQGVDFGKYLQRLLADVRRNWLPLIPEECRPPLNKQGITGISFYIAPNGKISGMNLDYSTHDQAIDRAAWGGITGLGQAQPLPKEFHGPNLQLRIEFRVNKDGQDAQ